MKWSESGGHLVVSDSLLPYGLQPTRFLCLWNSPGKNTEVGATPFSKRSSQPKDKTQVCIVGKFFTIWAARDVPLPQYAALNRVDMSSSHSHFLATKERHCVQNCRVRRGQRLNKKSISRHNWVIICQLTLYKSIDKTCTFLLYVQTRIEKTETKTLPKNELFPWFSVESSEMKC